MKRIIICADGIWNKPESVKERYEAFSGYRSEVLKRFIKRYGWSNLLGSGPLDNSQSFVRRDWGVEASNLLLFPLFPKRNPLIQLP